MGVIAIQIPIAAIDRIVSGGNNWEQERLGSSGEVYLVGPNSCLRSNPRFLIHDIEG